MCLRVDLLAKNVYNIEVKLKVEDSHLKAKSVKMQINIQAST